jgi:hypothetical protein
MRRRKSTAAQEEMIRSATTADLGNSGELTAAILDVGLDYQFHLAPDIGRLVRHESSLVRGQAARIVLYWAIEEEVPAALSMLASDPCWDARSDAAFGLGTFLHVTGRRDERILRALARAFETDPEEYVVTEAYGAMVWCLSGQPPAFSPDTLDRDRDVDWALIGPYLSRPR